MKFFILGLAIIPIAIIIYVSFQKIEVKLLNQQKIVRVATNLLFRKKENYIGLKHLIGRFFLKNNTLIIGSRKPNKEEKNILKKCGK